MAALGGLYSGGLLSADDYELFDASYRLLRTIEGRLRLMNSTARDQLPQDPTELAKLAHLLHYPGSEGLMMDFENATRQIRQRFERIFEEEGKKTRNAERRTKNEEIKKNVIIASGKTDDKLKNIPIRLDPELARFWDIHDLTDFTDELEEVMNRFLNAKRPSKFDWGLKMQAVQQIAQLTGIDSADLIRQWVIEKIQLPDDSGKLRRIR